MPGGVYGRGIQTAEKSVFRKGKIVVSSPRLNTEKVNRIISEAGKCQELGVKVTIVTWHPDAYKYGRAEVRMELMEKLRKADLHNSMDRTRL